MPSGTEGIEMAITPQTGHTNRESLRAEAQFLITRLRDQMDFMNQREQTFMSQMLDAVTMEEEWVP